MKMHLINMLNALMNSNTEDESGKEREEQQQEQLRLGKMCVQLLNDARWGVTGKMENAEGYLMPFLP